MHNHKCDRVKMQDVDHVHVSMQVDLPSRHANNELDEIIQRNLRAAILVEIQRWDTSLMEAQHLLAAATLTQRTFSDERAYDLLWLYPSLWHHFGLQHGNPTPDEFLRRLDRSRSLDAIALLIMNARTPSQRSELFAALWSHDVLS